jgi:hypothetical protein
MQETPIVMARLGYIINSVKSRKTSTLVIWSKVMIPSTWIDVKTRLIETNIVPCVRYLTIEIKSPPSFFFIFIS